MRNGTLGAGEWVVVGYVTLVLGSLTAGFFGSGQWYENVIAFVIALVIALVSVRFIALLRPRRRVHRD
jgi:polyferredoxin